MTEIAEAFARGKAFIPFITCGDPDLATSEELAVALARAGAGLVELGIPFSDPAAEGPVIQAASVRALEAGTTTDKVLDLAARIRARTEVPLVFMTYANLVYSYGVERFAEKARAVGAQGLILPDVPFEEKEEFALPCRAQGLQLISLVAPTSKERAATIAREAEGFLYCVSSLGVTGVRSSIAADAAAMVRLAKQAAPQLPCALGFGIARPDQARAMAAVADGVVVGSAIMQIVAEQGREAVEAVARYARSMKEACRSVD